MKIGTRLIVGFLAITALIWVSFFFAVNTYTRMHEEFDVLEGDVIPEVIVIGKVPKAASRVVHQVMEYIISGEEEAKEETQLMMEYLEKVGLEHEVLMGEEQRKIALELNAKIGALNSAVAGTIALKEQGASTGELFKSDREIIHPTVFALLEQVNMHEVLHAEELAEAEEAVYEARTSGMRILLLTAGFVTILAAGIALFITRSIVNPLRALHKGTEVIGQGNFDYKVGTGAKDEIGQLSRAFDLMTNDLKETTASIDDLNKEITERKQAEHSLSERIKELGCLYGIASIAERPGITLDEVYREVANLLPPSWQYPEITCARITFGDEEFRTDNFETSEWKQSSDIKVHGEKVGIVEVTYLEERPEIDEGPFMKEERLLIDAVAKRLGAITERKQAEHSLSERIKELGCLYGIAAIAERPGITLDEVYREVANLLPPSWQYPEITCVRITFGDEEFRTDNFETAEWVQSADINVRGQKKGTVEVLYLEERPEIDEGPFMKEERLLIDAVAKRLGAITERKQAEHSLSERIKELGCLYGIAAIAERPGITLDEVYREVANLLPPSWQYPEITCVRITFGDEEFRTDNFETAEWVQSADINVRGQKKGTVEVLYLEERPEIDEGPFMKEERLLIDAVAKRLGAITERKQAEEKLR